MVIFADFYSVPSRIAGEELDRGHTLPYSHRFILCLPTSLQDIAWAINEFVKRHSGTLSLLGLIPLLALGGVEVACLGVGIGAAFALHKYKVAFFQELQNNDLGWVAMASLITTWIINWPLSLLTVGPLVYLTVNNHNKIAAKLRAAQSYGGVSGEEKSKNFKEYVQAEILPLGFEKIREKAEENIKIMQDLMLQIQPDPEEFMKGYWELYACVEGYVISVLAENKKGGGPSGAEVYQFFSGPQSLTAFLQKLDEIQKKEGVCTQHDPDLNLLKFLAKLERRAAIEFEIPRFLIDYTRIYATTKRYGKRVVRKEGEGEGKSRRLIGREV